LGVLGTQENSCILIAWLLERDIFDLLLPEFNKPWVIHLRETCCCSTNLCTWRLNTVYKNRSVRRHQALFWRHCRGDKVKGTHILWLLSYLLVLLVCECSKLFPLDSAIISFCFLFLFSLVRLNGKQNKIRELYSIYLELGHEVFEEEIKKPMELYLHANSNVISTNSLNTITANAMEKYNLVEAGFDEHDIFSIPSTEEKIYFDDTIPPIYNDFNDEYDIFSPPTTEEKINYDYNMPPIFDEYGDENNNDSYFVEFAPTMINKNDYVYMESIDYGAVFM
jgi:hypothetical protein